MTKTHQKGEKEMLSKNLGIEIEFTGITRRRAAKVLADHLGGRSSQHGRDYWVAEPSGGFGRLFMMEASDAKRK